MSELYDPTLDYERTEPYPWQVEFWKWIDAEKTAGRINERPRTPPELLRLGPTRCTPAPFLFAAAKAARQMPEIWDFLIYEYRRCKVDPVFAARFEDDEDLPHLKILGRVNTYVNWYRMKYQEGEWYYYGQANAAVYSLLWHWVRGLVDENDDLASLSYLIDQTDVCKEGED